MTSEPELLGRLIACPGDGRRRDRVQAMAAADAHAHLTGFLLRRGSEIAARSTGLVSLLRAALDAGTAWGDAGLAFPAPPIISSLQTDAVDPVCVAASIAGHLYGCGWKSAWRAEFRTPCSIRFGGSMTPSVGTVAVDGDVIDCSSGLRPLGLVRIDERGHLWLAGHEDAEGLGLDASRPLSTGSIPARVNEMRAAIALISACAPDYVDWCADTVRIVAAWAGTAERASSGSVSGQPGVIYCSSPLDPVRIAESLIHEAAHQHFHLAQSEVRLHTLRDESEYWQPYVQAGRSIDRILLAYHAFANVLLFYQRLLASTQDQDLQRRATLTVAQHRPNVITFQGYLDRSDGLTPAGQALYRTLAERMAA